MDTIHSAPALDGRNPLFFIDPVLHTGRPADPAGRLPREMRTYGFLDQLLIDQPVIDRHEYIGCHPCINTSSLKLLTTDLLEKFLPAVHHPYILVNLP